MQLAADLHVHSVASGHAYSTILEIAQAAGKRGLAIIAITDHGPAMPGGPHLYHFGNLRVVPGELFGVRIFKGVEANVIDHEGGLDVPEHYLRALEVVSAGLHTICTPEGTEAQYTEAIIGAMNNPLVDFIVHPGNPEFLGDPKEIVRASRELGVPLEINNSSLVSSRKGSKPHCQVIARLAAEEGCPLIIGSDSHFADSVGRFDEALELCRQAGVREEQIINTTAEKTLAYLAERHGRRPKREAENRP